MNFSIETNFDNGLISEVSYLIPIHGKKTNNISFFSTYIDNSIFFDHIKYIIDSGFNYIFVLDSFFIKNNINYIFEIIDKLYFLGVRELEISDELILAKIIDKFNDIKTNFILINTNISLKKIKSLSHITNINKFILDSSFNYEIETIKKISRTLKKTNTLLELIGNEISFGENESNYSDKSSLLNLKDKINFIINNPIKKLIRPVDLKIFEDNGVKSIKLFIKTCSLFKIKFIIESYLLATNVGNALNLYYGNNLFNSLYISDKFLISDIKNGKLEISLGKNRQRLLFMKYFSDDSYYISNFESYFEYRFDEGELYSGYVTSVFVSDKKFNITIRNNLLLNYLKNLINTNDFQLIKKLLLLIIDKKFPVTISYGGYEGYIRIYFNYDISFSSILEEYLGFKIPDGINDSKKNFLIGLDFKEIKNIKIYSYSKEYNNISDLDKNIHFDTDLIDLFTKDKIKFALQKDYGINKINKERLYFRFNNGLMLSKHLSFYNFFTDTFLKNDFNNLSDRLINFYVVNLDDKKRSVYIKI